METAQALLKGFTALKTLPHVEIRLSNLISDENTSIREFEEVIRVDPTLVVRILRLVNSSYFGLRETVTSISRAVVFIGTKNLRNMVVTEALKSIFENSPDREAFSRSRLWLHCAAVSVCSQMICERIFKQKGEDAFLCGILHDIGMIVEHQVAPDQFIRACEAYEPSFRPITHYERTLIGTDHCELGYLLAREWKLPGEVQEGIRDHHTPLKRVSPSSITGIIQTAGYIVSKLNYPALPGMNGMLSPPLTAHIRDNGWEYEVLGGDLPEEIAKARELYEVYEGE
jgi:putative nucleotidyltransferase with HDIG domain